MSGACPAGLVGDHPVDEVGGFAFLGAKDCGGGFVHADRVDSGLLIELPAVRTAECAVLVLEDGALDVDGLGFVAGLADEGSASLLDGQ